MHILFLMAFGCITSFAAVGKSTSSSTSSSSSSSSELSELETAKLLDQGELEGFVEIQQEGVPAGDIGSFLKGCADTAVFLALRKSCSRRTLIRTIYELGYKKNAEGTIASLSKRKEYNENYYLDVAISEARLHNDAEFVIDILPLISLSLRSKCIFSRANALWLDTVLKNNNKDSLEAMQQEMQRTRDYMAHNTFLCDLLRSSLPKKDQEASSANSAAADDSDL